MKKQIIYSLKSPYRENLDVIGFTFGNGEKSACIVGSTRGNEVQQMYVCSQVVHALKKMERQGEIAEGKSIMVIPCVNYYSMNIGKRFWTMDNTDINRMFPGYELGETTQRIADGVFRQIQGFEFGIQLASFYQSGDFLPHVKMMQTGFGKKEKMLEFGLPYSLVRTPRPYDTTTLNYNWQIWETQAFSVYSYGTETIDENAAQISVDAILRFLSAEGIVKANVKPGYVSRIIDEHTMQQIHTEHGGIFKTRVKIGETVYEGQVLGEVYNPLDGEKICEVKADKCGTVFFIYNKPLIMQNSVAYKIIDF